METTPDALTDLAAWFPIVILAASVLLGSEAADKVKKALPAILSIVVAVVYFIVDTWPGFGAELLVSVGALMALSYKGYDALNSILQLLPGGKGLNDLTGPGAPRMRGPEGAPMPEEG